MGDGLVDVRAATVDDAPALADVSARAWEATYRGMIPDAELDGWIASTHDGWREVLERLAGDTPSRCWVADRDGTVVGYATTSPATDKWLSPPDGAGELTNLYLDPDVMGRGVGRMLYEHAVDDLRARGFDPLVVWAFRDNHRARRFYERQNLEIDVADHNWELAGVPCPIVRFVGLLRPTGSP